MNIKHFLLRTVLPTGLITTTVLLAVSPLSCKMTEEGIQVLTGDFSVPHLDSIHISDEKSALLSFDKPVKAVTASLVCSESKEEIEATESFTDENKTISFAFAEETVVGNNYTISGTVTDNCGNTLTFSIPFTGYNAHVPVLVLSEVRNAYSTTSTTDSTTKTTVKKHKCEFVELYALSDGNLAGTELVSAGDGEAKKYVFPPVTVSKGEYIVVHLRKAEDGCVDETGTDLACSTATDSCPTARDFWIDNTKARLSSSDIIMVRNANNNKLIDVLVFATSKTESWSDSYSAYVSAVEQSGIWCDSDGTASCSIESAVSSDAITSSAATRTFSRDISNLIGQDFTSESVITNNAEQWIITANKGSGKTAQPGATPGLPNSTNAYAVE